MPPRSADPKTKWRRTKALARARFEAAALLSDIQTTAPGTPEHGAMVVRSVDVLRRYLYITASKKQLDALRQAFPSLPDPWESGYPCASGGPSRT